jgi:hypothetical protein
MERMSISNLLVLGLVALAIVGCTSNGTSFPIGEYRHSGGGITNYMDGGTFTHKFANGTILVEEGRYSVDGDIITFVDETCPAVEGVYHWTNQGGDILLELVEDDCSARASSLDNELLKPLDEN